MQRARLIRRGSGQRGVTLLELIVVIAIIGLSVGITLPNLVQFFRQLSLNGAMRTFTSDCRKMRQLAVTDATRTRVFIDTVGAETDRTYRLQRDNAGTWVDVGTNPQTMHESVNFRSTTFTDEEIIFATNGTVANLPMGDTANVALRSKFPDLGRPQYVITFQPSGQLKVQ